MWHNVAVILEARTGGTVVKEKDKTSVLMELTF